MTGRFSGLYERLPNKDDVPRPLDPALPYNRDHSERVVCWLILLAIASLVFVALLVSHVLKEPGDRLLALTALVNGASWRIIDASTADPLLPAYHKQKVAAERVISAECAEEWIAGGQPCHDIKSRLLRPVEHSLSIVWTWVNGSSELHREWQKAALTNLRLPKATAPDRRRQYPPRRRPVPERKRPPNGAEPWHFRTHNELLYSMRSTMAIPESVIHSRILFTGDVPAQNNSYRLAQVPTWLPSSPLIRLQHHWEAFRSRNIPSAGTWRTRALPTFNSLAIESQLGHLDTAETLLYMNDDFVTTNLTLTDVATPLYGPVIRIQRDLPVFGRQRTASPVFEGEWPNLEYTNWLLDQRFGQRPRPYTTHTSKTFVKPVLNELEAIWGAEFARTASSRFRGRQAELHISLMAVHYTVEKHREILLWSFVLGRRLSRADTITLLEQTTRKETSSNTEIHIAWPNRTSLDGAIANIDYAGLSAPAATTFEFVSADGYAYIALGSAGSHSPVIGGGMGTPFSGASREPNMGLEHWPSYRWHDNRPQTAAILDVERCLPAGEDLDHRFRHVAFEEPKCGDALIVALLQLSGEAGLAAFLPPATETSHVDNDDIPGSLGKTHAESTFAPPSSRLQVVRLLQRYSYVVGMSNSRFLNVKSIVSLEKWLGEVATARRTGSNPAAFTVVNDDIRDARLSLRYDTALAKWFAAMWPDPAPWETRG